MNYLTGRNSRFNTPQIRIDRDEEEGLSLVKIFGAEFIVKSSGREKSFRETLNDLNKKVLLYEGGKSLDIDTEITNTGLAGALRIMHHLGMRNFDEELASIPHKKNKPKLMQSSKWIRAKHSGMFHPMVPVGSKVDKKTIIGSVSGPFGYFERSIKAGDAGYIICINQSPIVNQGDVLFHLTKE